jgi:putative transposase
MWSMLGPTCSSLRGPPEYIGSDSAAFIAKKARAWIGAVGAKAAFIAPGSPGENGYYESFNARFRDEMLNGEVFYRFRRVRP